MQANGIPRSVNDLDKHSLICFGTGLPSPISNIDWILKIGKESGKRKAKFRVNSIYGISLAIEKGAGLASLPDYMAADKSHLVRVLPNLEGPSYQTYFLVDQPIVELAHSKGLHQFVQQFSPLPFHM